MTNKVKISLQEMISNGNIKQAINCLLSAEMNESSKKEAFAIAARYKKLEQKGKLGVLSFEQESVTENQIVARLLDLISHLDDQLYQKEKSIDQINPTKSVIWKYITTVVVVIGILGSLAEVFNLINIIPQKGIDEKLQLTVFVTDTQGNVVLENEGRLNIPLGNRSLNEVIGANGRTNFPDITADNKGDTISIGLDVENWEIANGKNTFIFTGDPIRLKVKKDDSLGIIKGVVKSRDGQKVINSARILINADTTILTNGDGVFKIVLAEEMRVKKETDGYRLTVSKKGYKTKTQYYYPKSSNAEIRLKKQK